MKATKNFIITFLLISISAKFYSQSGKSISLEGGALHNRILSQEVPINNAGFSDIGFYGGGCIPSHQIPYYDVKTSDGDYGSGYGAKFKFFNTTGYFLKSAYQKRIFTSKSWDFLLPIGISYQHKIDKFSSHRWAYGNFGNFSQHTTQEITSKIINVSLGAILKYHKQSYYIETSIYFNIAKTIKRDVEIDTYDGIERHMLLNSDYTNQNVNRFMGSSLSTQISGGYYITKTISVGPALEVFFTSKTSIFRKSDIRSTYFGSYENYIFGLNKKNIWINPGIKLQIDLK